MGATNIVTVPGLPASRALFRHHAQVSLDLAASEAAGFLEAARGARCVEIQSSFELHLSRVPEPLIAEGQSEAEVRLDSGDQAAKVVQVVGSDPATSSHDESPGHDGAVLGIMVLLARAAQSEELVTCTCIELLASFVDHDGQLGLVCLRFVVQPCFRRGQHVCLVDEPDQTNLFARVGGEIAGDVDVLVAFKKAWNDD